MPYSVYISPSAQERNVGARGYGTEEKRMNQVADVVERILRSNDVVTYRNDPDWALERIVKDSNSKRPDLHLAIHSNAGGGSGCEVYAYSRGCGGAEAAKAIYAEMERITPPRDRGVKYSALLYELKWTIAPAALVEVGFHDNPEEAVWIMENITNIGTALAKGVMKFLKMIE